MLNKKILVFDSGLGGLSICREIIAASPDLQIHYLSDNAAFPYGGKEKTEVISRALTVIETALDSINANLIVIACNTASTAVLPALRERVSIPVVGVVPAIKTAAALTQTGTIGLLATPGTVSRNYTKSLIAQYAANHNVISVGSSSLVELIETHIYGSELDSNAVAEVLAEFEQHQNAQDIDTVVLGCTHFPLIRSTLARLRNDWRWVDSGAAIASRVCSLLEIEPLSSSASAAGQAQRQAWFTQAVESPEHLNHYLRHKGFNASRILRV